MSGPQEPKLWRGALPRILISLALAGGFLWLLMRGGLPLVPPREGLARLPWWALAGHVGLMVVVTFLRTYRWNFLIRPIAPESHPLRVLGIAMVGFSAIFLLPLRSGEIVRPYLIAQDGRLSFMQAAGTVAAERVIDGLMLTLLTFVALLLATPISPLPSSLGDLPLPVSAVPAAVYTMLTVFSGAFAVMTAFYVARRQARLVTEKVLGLVSKRAASSATATLERLADGLRFLPSKTDLLPFLAATAGCWTLTIAAQWVVLRGLSVPATMAQATTTVGVQALGSLVPAGPGMFGAFQISGFSALAMYFPIDVVRLEGAVFLFVTYTAALAINSLQFLLGFWLMNRVPASKAAA
jgi:glycosyltransferase 2 family protein